MTYDQLVDTFVCEVNHDAPPTDIDHTLDLIAAQYPERYRCFLAQCALAIVNTKGDQP